MIPPKNNYPYSMPKVDLFGQGFPYIAGALKKAGHEVFGINLNHQWCNDSAADKLAASIHNAIREYKPHFIGVGGLSGDYSFIRDEIRFIRHSAPDIHIVCGGGIVTYDREYIFTNLRPDFAVSGEAEENIAALADCIGGGGNISNIPNIAYWKGEKAAYTRIEHPNTKLEEFPLPDYAPFDYERFMRSFNQTDAFYSHTRLHPRIMPISLGRSCPFQCTFCCHTEGPKYRERSIDNAIEEIVHFYDRYHFNILFIYDELFSIKKNRVSELCAKIKKLRENSGMDFDWTCDLRVADVDEDLLKEMKDAGCIFIGYGLESASPKILESMKKKTTVVQIERAIRLTNEAGIGVQGNFIFGDIAEMPQTAEETIDFFNKYCRDLMVFLSHIMPYPGSEIFQYCIDNGIIKDKQSYYNKVSPFGLIKINMTKMPDDVFFNIINSIEKTMHPVGSALKLKETSILSCEKTGEFTDLETPFLLRRRLYRVKVMCPHCRELVDYLSPFNAARSDCPKQLRTYCKKCHKRFLILLQTVLNRYDNLKKTTLSLFPYFMRPGLGKIYRAIYCIVNFIPYLKSLKSIKRSL